MKLKVLITQLHTDSPVREDAGKLRGFIGRLFPEHVLLHHHVDGEVYLFTYPRVQYKILEGVPFIIALNEGVDVLKRISYEISTLKLGGKTYVVEHVQMNQFYADFGRCTEQCHYQFLTPWLAFNEENYRVFSATKNWKEKKKILNNILVGNILSMCKGLNYPVSGRIYTHTFLHHEIIRFKSVFLSGFTGEFKVNFNIPDFLGVGKSVSHGFGTVKRMRV